MSKEIRTEVPYSVTDFDVVKYAKERLVPNLLLAADKKPIPNHWHNGTVPAKEVIEDGAQYIAWLIDIITRLQKHVPPCKKCGGVGSYMERMGGCRDDNESVVCSECNGQFAK